MNPVIRMLSPPKWLHRGGPYLPGVLKACGRWLSDHKNLAKLARTKSVYHKSIF